MATLVYSTWQTHLVQNLNRACRSIRLMVYVSVFAGLLAGLVLGIVAGLGLLIFVLLLAFGALLPGDSRA